MTRRSAASPRIEADLPLDEFCLVGCGVITAFGAVLNIADVRAGDTVVVVGCGGVGINVIQAARIAGSMKIVAVDSVPDKLDLATRLGATHVLDARSDVVAGLAEIEPYGADVVFEVVGNPDLLAQALGLARVGGKCVMVGIPPIGSKITLDSFTLVGNRQLLGCRGGAVEARRDTARLVSFYRSGHLKLSELVGQRLGLDNVDKAFAALGSSTFARSVVTFR